MSDSSTIVPIIIGGTSAANAPKALEFLLPTSPADEGLMLSTTGDGVLWSDVEDVGISISRYLGKELRTVVSQSTITRQLDTKADVTHANITNSNTAFSWGNHLAANYINSLGLYVNGPGLWKSGWRFNVEFGLGEILRAVEGHHPYLNSLTVKQTRIHAGKGLTGGGTLAANRTFSINFGEIAGSVAEGDDLRIIKGDLAFKRGDHKTFGYLTIVDILEHADVMYTTGAGISMSYTPLSAIIGPTPPPPVPPLLPGLEDPSVTQFSTRTMSRMLLNSTVPKDQRDFQMVPTINLDFGTGPNQVAAGDDYRFNLAEEAFNWGNPAEAGYVKRSDLHSYVTNHFSIKPNSGLSIGPDGCSLNLSALFADDPRYTALTQRDILINGKELGTPITAADIGACECPHEHVWFDVIAHNSAALVDFHLICGVDTNNDIKDQFPPAVDDSILVTCISDFCISIDDVPEPPGPVCPDHLYTHIKMNIPNGGVMHVRLPEFSKANFKWDHEDEYHEIDEYFMFEFVDMEEDENFFGIHSLFDPDTEEPIRFRPGTLYLCGGEAIIAGPTVTEVIEWVGVPVSFKFYDTITETPCENLTHVPEEILPTMTDADDMFRSATVLESDISMWDTSNILSMKRMLLHTPLQLSDISEWCVHNIDEEPILFRTHDFVEYDDDIPEEEQPEFDLTDDPHQEFEQPGWGIECW